MFFEVGLAGAEPDGKSDSITLSLVEPLLNGFAGIVILQIPREDQAVVLIQAHEVAVKGGIVCGGEAESVVGVHPGFGMGSPGQDMTGAVDFWYVDSGYPMAPWWMRRDRCLRRSPTRLLQRLCKPAFGIGRTTHELISGVGTSFRGSKDQLTSALWTIFFFRDSFFWENLLIRIRWYRRGIHALEPFQQGWPIHQFNRLAIGPCLRLFGKVAGSNDDNPVSVLAGQYAQHFPHDRNTDFLMLPMFALNEIPEQPKTRDENIPLSPHPKNHLPKNFLP